MSLICTHASAKKKVTKRFISTRLFSNYLVEVINIANSLAIDSRVSIVQAIKIRPSPLT